MKMKFVSMSLVLLLGVSFSSLLADQPHMQTALAQLRSARAELQKAAADKAGHRKNAIALVDKAIAEVEIGESAARPAPAR